MGFIPMICPQCGAQIEIVDSRDFGFCSYCGTKIVRDKIVIEHRGSISLDHSAEIKICFSVPENACEWETLTVPRKSMSKF